MPNPTRVLAPLAIAVTCLSTACTDLVQRPVECAPLPPPLGHSALAWQRAATPGIQGFVVTPGSLAPIHAAVITLKSVAAEPKSPASTVQTLSEANGSFRIDTVSPARYLLHVRRLGYQPVRETVQVHADSGIVATAVLAQEIIRFDECGTMYQEVRVPWWKR